MSAFWGDMPAAAFADTDPDKTIAILPIAAMEQHGPHLPISTDTTIAHGMLGLVAGLLPDGMDARILPIQAVGKSNEHLYAPGTLTLPPNLLIEAWTELGASIHRAGIRKLVIVNSHGGNEEMMGIVARELRVRFEMFVAKSSWMRFGAPEGLYSEEEWRLGIHGGEVETSLMLHFRPDLVDMSKAQNFDSIATEMERDYALIRPTGVHAFAWIARDVNAHGVAGNASAGTTDKGEATALHQAKGFVTLLKDVEKVPLSGGFASF